MKPTSTAFLYRLHTTIDQPRNPPPPAGPPDFVQGGQIAPGQIAYCQLLTYAEDGTTYEGYVPVQGWLADAAGTRCSSTTNARTNEDGEIEIYFFIPAKGTPDVSFAPTTPGGTISMFTFTGRRTDIWTASAITIPVFVG